MTRGDDMNPTVRVMQDADGKELIVSIGATFITIRPKGSRVGGETQVSTTPGAVYIRALMGAVEREKAERRRERGTPVRAVRSLL